MLRFIFTIVVPILTNTIEIGSAYPVISTPLGDVEGTILQSLEGRPIYSFRGIRYAKPPVGDLRFQPPVPVEKWNGIYDATEDGPICPQPKLTPTSEDCLFINVYTTKLPENGENPNRPVSVFIPYGGLYFASGSSKQLGPQYLLDQDIVLVTFNYRLGTLGLLSTGDEVVPGNNAFRDQVLALKWVKDNIRAFGGNPDAVTLHGYSVGAASASLHLVSPMSQGLFHQAILQSNSLMGTWPIPTHQFGIARRQARLVGCLNDTSANIYTCLKAKPAQEIANTALQLKEFAFDPVVMWFPVVELDTRQEGFLPDDPTKLAVCGNLPNIPIMTGRTTDEFFHLTYFLNSTLMEQFSNNFEDIAPIGGMYERGTDKSRAASKRFKEFYLNNGPITDSSLNKLGKWYSDAIVGFPTNRFAEILARKNSEPVYYYHFSYKGRHTFFPNPTTKEPNGVLHYDDLIYVFHNSLLFPLFTKEDPEYPMIKKMTQMIGNFVKTGNPTSTLSEELNVTWEPYNVQTKKYLEIDEQLTMKEDLFSDRYAVWEEALPLPECI